MELSYKIAVNDEITSEIDELDANHTVIDKGLEPDLVYNVSFIAFISYDGKTTRIASERKQLRMLPAGTETESHRTSRSWNPRNGEA